jgi:hypothetical protein
MFNIDDLVDAALKEDFTGKSSSVAVSAPPPKSEFQKLADVLEQEAKKGAQPEDRDRFNKLAMAVIIDTIDDPKAKKGLEALTHDIVKNAQISGGMVNETPEPGTIGEATDGTGKRTRVLEKHRVDTGRTLFKKLQGETPGPSTPTND